MVFLNLYEQSFKEISMKIDLGDEEQIDVESTFSFGVKYDETDSFCMASLRQEVQLKNDPTKFSIVVEGVGQFSCEGILTDEDKKTAHIHAYTLLFPYVQHMVAQMTASAGLPPLMLKMDCMKAEDVNIESN